MLLKIFIKKKKRKIKKQYFGLCISKKNNLNCSNIIIKNKILFTKIKQIFPIYSNFIKIKILRRKIYSKFSKLYFYNNISQIKIITSYI